MRNLYYSKSLDVDINNKSNLLDQPLYEIKRDLILFDEVVFPNLIRRLQFMNDHYGQDFGYDIKIPLSEFHNLLSNGIIKDYDVFSKLSHCRDVILGMTEHDAFTYSSMIAFAESIAKGNVETYNMYQKENDKATREDMIQHFTLRENWMDSLMSRVVTEHMQRIDRLDAVDSLLLQKGYRFGDMPIITIDKPTVYSFLLKDLPLPSDITPWQDISDYRIEIENKRRLVSLRKWLGKVVKEKYSINELADEYEDFYLNFESAMNRHTKKTKKTWLKIIVVGGSEIVEDFVKLRLKNISGKIFKNFIEISTESMKLTEAEASASGREVSYMFFSKEEFNK